MVTPLFNNLYICLIHETLDKQITIKMYGNATDEAT